MLEGRQVMVAALALALLACSGSSSGGAKHAGDFSLEGMDGGEHHLTDYRGRVVMVLFFSSYDQRSQALLGQLSGLQSRHADRGLSILAVSIDGPETVAQVKRIARTRKIEVPIAFDPDTSVGAHYNPKGIVPYGVFFDREGRVLDRWLGHDRNDLKALEERIGTLLAE